MWLYSSIFVLWAAVRGEVLTKILHFSNVSRCSLSKRASMAILAMTLTKLKVMLAFLGVRTMAYFNKA
jgi:hypothetical protein